MIKPLEATVIVDGEVLTKINELITEVNKLRYVLERIAPREMIAAALRKKP